MSKRVQLRVEVILTLIICMIFVWIGLVNPGALTLNTLFGMLRSAIVPGIFAVGVLMVLISGGTDVSFTYIAPAAAYTTVVILEKMSYTGSIVLPFVLAALLGMLMGMVNGWLVGKYGFPALIVTLGTGTIFHGLTVCFVDTRHITNLPGQMTELSKTNLFEMQFADGSKGGISAAILITIAVIAAGYFILNKTMWGHGIYAIGGSKQAAINAGFNVFRIQFMMYSFVGAMAGIAGIVFMSLNRQAQPHMLVGGELDVIAAVVLGGASVFGGKGKILGTVLGVALTTVLSNSLILVGIPAQWQRAATGVVILFGTALPLILRSVQKRRVQA